MERRTMIYKLSGDPVILMKARPDDTGKSWNNQKHAKTIAVISLESQHAGQPLFSGPIAIEINFFFKRPLKNQSAWRIWHFYDPGLMPLFAFIQDACRGTLYQNASIVSAVSMKKMYDEEPHTEIIIHELSKEDANKIKIKKNS